VVAEANTIRRRNAARANGEKKYDDARHYAESPGADADVASARIRR
jgi:hypothetical protein